MKLLASIIGKDNQKISYNDLLNFIKATDIEYVNFIYVGEDGKIKKLSFYNFSLDYIKKILLFGERADGSSIFKFLKNEKSDIYIVPIYNTAFIDPFSKFKSINVFCTFFDSFGNELNVNPFYILKKANKYFEEKTNLRVKVLGELEFFIIYDKSKNKNTEYNEFNLKNHPNYKSYHESYPYILGEDLRLEAMKLICELGGKVKYSHTECACFSFDNYYIEQHEIEFLLDNVVNMANLLYLAKWVLHNLAKKYDVIVSFIPKIALDKAGNGLHFHYCFEDFNGSLVEDESLIESSIKGLISNADLLCAFGNTIPISYLRFLPGYEAPIATTIGQFNRTSLIRIPLSWDSNKDIVAEANSFSEKNINLKKEKTIEYRAADGSANIYLFLSAFILSIVDGILNQNLQVIEKNLPKSCYEAALALEYKKNILLENEIFPKSIIDYYIEKLKSFEDKDLKEKFLYDSNLLKNEIEKYIFY